MSSTRLGVEIPKEFHKQLKNEAKQEGKYFGTYINELIYLGRKAKDKKVVGTQPTYNDQDIKITNQFYDYLGKKFTSFTKKPTKGDYAKMHRLCAKHGYEEVKTVLRFTVQDSFWGSNVLSVSGLVKHYDKLAAKSQDSVVEVVSV